MREQVLNQLDKWEHEGVEGHFTEPTPWLTIDDTVKESMARLVGALPCEVVMMNSLTCNIHMMMVSFYQPTTVRHKVLMEKKAFPSDIHAVSSQILFHGYDPDAALIEISPREGETILSHADIEEVLEREGDNIALVLLSGVQYYTGQVFNMQRITTVARAKGCCVGFDLAHAVGNIPLSLHDWDVDFACWCTYKYMNCGPGSIGGCFVHERHSRRTISPDSRSSTDIVQSMEAVGMQSIAPQGDSASYVIPHPALARDVRFAGWWGHRLVDRFHMGPAFVPEPGAYGYRVSNPSVLLIACVRASLDLFDQVSEATFAIAKVAFD